VEFPLIFFMNGNRTHLTYQLSELCSELSIVLIFLYPNAPRFFLPLDVATFRPQKMGWKKAVLEMHRQNSDKMLHKEWLAPLLDEALNKSSRLHRVFELVTCTVGPG
jgi:DDE superfamily endonuclease.